MADLVITKGEDGQLAGLDEKGERAWRKWLATIKALATGDTLTFSYRLPRSPGFHKRHFKILAAVFNQQDQFDDPDNLRKWLEVGAGFCDLVPGPHGKPVAMPRSIAWDRLEQAEFEWHHTQVMQFLRSTRATHFLWPQLDDLAADTLVNNVLAHFGE